MDAATAAAGYIVTVSNESSVTCTVGRATASNTISGTTSDFSLPPLAAITFVVAPSGAGYSIKSTVGVTLTGSQTLTNKTLTSPVINTSVSGTALATQAQQETGTATDVLVTPGTQQFHASAAKGWGMATAAGAAVASYNLSSITDGGAGIATFNWNVDFSSATYCAVASAKATAASAVVASIEDTTFAAGATRVNAITTTTGALTDPNHFMCAVFGDQA